MEEREQRNDEFIISKRKQKSENKKCAKEHAVPLLAFFAF